MMDEARKRLIFALDVDSFEKAQAWVDQLHQQVGLFKVGKQLFTRCGPRVIEMIRERGGDVFLDLKYTTSLIPSPRPGLRPVVSAWGCSTFTLWAVLR